MKIKPTTPHQNTNHNHSSDKFRLHKSPLLPILATTSLAGILIATLAITDANINNQSVSATTTEATYGDYYLSLSNNDSINLDITVTAAGDYTYATDNVTVTTNIPSGYDLYLASMSSTSASLTTTSGNTTITATSGTGGTSGTPTTLSANSYGYAVPSAEIKNNNFDNSYDTPSSTSKFAKVPIATTNNGGDKLRSTNAQVTSGETTHVHYGLYANNALIAGDYTGGVVYTAVVTDPNSIATSIEPNSGIENLTKSVTVTSGPLIANGTSLSTSEVSITIGNSACTVTNVDTTNNYLTTTCTAPALTTGTYNVTVSVPKYGFTDTITNGYTVTPPIMQSSEVIQNCLNATNGTTFTVYDSRDNSSYTIARLKDGNCWMSQNLRLTGSRTLTSADSDVTDDFALPASSTGWGNIDYDTDQYEMEGIYDSSECYSNGGYWNPDEYWDDELEEYVDNGGTCYGITYSNVTTDAGEAKLYNTGDTTQGVYYNWYTATAGKGTTADKCYADYSYDYEFYNMTYDEIVETLSTYHALVEDVDYQIVYDGNYEPGTTEYDEDFMYEHNFHIVWINCPLTLEEYAAQVQEYGGGYSERININPTASICPKGWTIPRSTDVFKTLGRAYKSGARIEQSYYAAAPLSYSATRYYSGGRVQPTYGSSYYGRWWTKNGSYKINDTTDAPQLKVGAMEYRSWGSSSSYMTFYDNSEYSSSYANINTDALPAYQGLSVRCYTSRTIAGL